MTWADAARRELAASVAQTAVCDTPRPRGSWLEHGRARTLSRMNEDSPDDPLDDDALKALLERPFTELSFDELMAMKAAYAARGIQIHNSASFEQLVLAFLAGNVAVPFVQALSPTPGTLGVYCLLWCCGSRVPCLSLSPFSW